MTRQQRCRHQLRKEVGSPNVHYGNAQKPERAEAGRAAAKDARLWKSCENHLPADTQIFFRLIFIAQLRYEAKISDLLISIYNKITFIYGCICVVTQTAEKSLEFSACNICIFIHFRGFAGLKTTQNPFLVIFFFFFFNTTKADLRSNVWILLDISLTAV